MNFITSRMFIRCMTQNLSVKLYNNAPFAGKNVLELKSKMDKVQILQINTYNLKTLIDLEDNINKKSETKVNSNNIIERENVLIHMTDGKSVTESTSPPPDKKEKKKKQKKPIDVEIIDIRKLDFRIGKILEINKHSEADTLYVGKVDCGGSYPRTVVSGLVNHISIEELKNRNVMVLCNVKPSKMRGVLSEGMLMTATSPDKTEVLIPPKDAIPGDLVQCEGYPREPDEELKPKKKIFEKCSTDLKTNNERIVCYNDSPLVVLGKGPIIAPTLKGANVK